MAIKPTVDSVGDAALTNSIIDKSITELQDNVVTRLRDSALSSCAALKKAVFGAVTGSQGSSIFSNCTALETVEFHQNVSFGSYSFQLCSALKALILRSTTLCEIGSVTPLEDSSIASGNGYIYVPAALVDAYKAHSGWGQYTSQIRAIEDHPEVCEPYSWAAVAAHIDAGDYASVYAIGDEVPVDLGSEGIINMQIAAFDTDTLADGSGTAAISWVAKELLKTDHRMNPVLEGSSGAYTEGTGGIGGWEKCEMRAYLINTIKPMIPSNVLGLIQTVTKSQPSFDTTASSSQANGDPQTTEDDVWIPAKEEMKTGIYAALFPSNASLVKVRSGTTYNTAWWYRSAGTTPKNFWYNYGNTNGQTTSVVTTSRGVCLGFCTGRTPT